jgi:hypothetical protein
MFMPPTEDTADDMKDSFCDGLERLFDKFAKYRIKNISVPK